MHKYISLSTLKLSKLLCFKCIDYRMQAYESICCIFPHSRAFMRESSSSAQYFYSCFISTHPFPLNLSKSCFLSVSERNASPHQHHSFSSVTIVHSPSADLLPKTISSLRSEVLAIPIYIVEEY